MKTSVLRRQTKSIGKHPDLRAAAAAASEKMNDVVESPPLLPARNFPEILARDLEMSEATFLAKSMTAGTPIRSLATPEGERQRHQKPLYVGTLDAKNSHVHWEQDALSKERGLGVIDETSYHSNSSDNGTPSEVASLTSDSGSDSLADMEPPAVGMRQQSVCTAATSVMAHHCLPSKEQPRYSFVAFEDSYQGQSWIDLDMADSEDDDDDEHSGKAQAARPGSPTKRVKQDDVVPPKGTVDAFTSSSGSDKPCRGNDLPPAQALPLDKVVASLPDNSFHTERPRTSSGISVLDKPHPTPRSLHCHKRSSSAEVTSGSLFEFQASYPRNWASTSTALASQGSKFDHEILRSEANPAICRNYKRLQAEMASPRHATSDQVSITCRLAPTHETNNISSPGITQATRIKLGVAKDDEPTATDVISEYARPERHEDQPDGVEADASVTESVLANERMSRIDIPQQLYQEIVSGSSQPTTNPLRMNPPEMSTQGPQAAPPIMERADSSDSSIDETFFRSKIVLPEAENYSRPASGLPPAPAIPTISSSSRPATRSTPINMRLHPDVFSRLETSIAGFPDTMLSTKALPIEIIRSLPKSRSYTPSSSTSFSALDMALEQPDSTPALSHKWKISSLRSRHPNPPPPPPPSSVPLGGSSSTATPSPPSIIQRIFPLGNDLHCDALYAHLVAYLYVSTLCGPDSFYTSTSPSSMSRQTTSVPRATNPSRNLMHKLIPLHDETSIAVPAKASSFLGMGTAIPPPDPTTTATSPKLSKMRSLLSFNGRVGGKCARPTRMGEEVGGGRMVPAKPSSTDGGCRSKPVTETDVRKVQAGLLRCVRNLVAKLRVAAAGEGEGDVAMLREDDFEIDAQGWRTLDPYFLRALCEIVRAEEDKLLLAGVMLA